ncbi:MAG: hypothetical protein O7A63_10000 [Acidobacteria bacterium]|nr:hypothetical protein [Acidobacteriota bacterium]
MTHPLKDCFGTVISNLKKMKECVRCELLVECRSVNWQEALSVDGPVAGRVTASGGAVRGGGRDPVRGGAAGS